MNMNERCLQGLDNLPPQIRGCVLTIGNFDGVHLGHQRLIHTARALAEAEGAAVVAMTFDPPPDRVIRPIDVPERITPPDVRCQLLLEAGCDYVITVKATPALFAMSADDFIKDVIVGKFAPRHMVEGENFFFGRGRTGNVKILSKEGLKYNFTVQVADAVMLEIDGNPTVVSSTLIRNLILAGKISDANRAMGRHFTLYGPVIGGQKQGRMLEFPTANIDRGDQVSPADGVYAGRAELDGEKYVAAISIGNKPTLGPTERVIEAFLLGAEGDFYGMKMALSFIDRLRGQQRLDSIDALKAQIEKDVRRVREIVKNAG